ncbi:MAG: hypothetical protein WC433_08505 [Candidatus Omnitrophota bacterium]|jgi:G:T-mismatch repair DNA endonuclease (very short patch repair protein)/DNA-directed RNA polymerase subunit RPC12/RpoP
MKHTKYFRILTKPFLMKEYIKNNQSSVAISKKIGVPPVTIRNYLKRFNIKRRSTSEILKERWSIPFNSYYFKWYKILTKDFLFREYVENKKTIAFIANKVNCSNATVFRYLSKHQIKIRHIKVDGRTSKIYNCKNCGKEISKTSGIYGSGLCGSCSKKGDKANKFKDGRCLKKYYCMDCGKEITYQSALFGNGRCRSCASKIRLKGRKLSQKHKNKLSEIGKLLWKDLKHKERMLKLMRVGKKITPNKPEKELNILLGKDYKYVGDGEVWFNNFNPDFINCNGQKKIVELYGCYWHKCKICGFGNGKQPKDVGRLKEYKKLGYSTLIVWEHELKNIDKLTHRLIEFNNK